MLYVQDAYSDSKKGYEKTGLPVQRGLFFFRDGFPSQIGIPQKE